MRVPAVIWWKWRMANSRAEWSQQDGARLSRLSSSCSKRPRGLGTRHCKMRSLQISRLRVFFSKRLIYEIGRRRYGGQVEHDDRLEGNDIYSRTLFIQEQFALLKFFLYFFMTSFRQLNSDFLSYSLQIRHLQSVPVTAVRAHSFPLTRVGYFLWCEDNLWSVNF